MAERDLERDVSAVRVAEEIRLFELEVPQQLVGRRQAIHLATTGHRRIGYGYPDDHRLRVFAEPRLAGVRHECQDRQVGGPAIETVALNPFR